MNKIKLSEIECCGCSACSLACPQKCISMKEDKEGFLRPEINYCDCIKCGICLKVCPVTLSDKKSSKIPLSAYAANNPDNVERLQSSSGGLFIVFAKAVLADNGVVFGAVFDKNWEVHHTFAEKMDDVHSMMGSKYLQSRMENSYADVERFLKQGRKVLFSGTPCQIQGLHSYLRKEYENLLTVDFVCHGVPSPGVWRKYLKELSQKEELYQISKIEFRNKIEGWKRYHIHVCGIFCGKDSTKEKEYSKYHWDDPYMQGFLSDIYLRPSCCNCHAKAGKSNSDITIADFWGIENVLPDFDDDKGAGLLLVNTPPGKEFIASFELNRTEVIFAQTLTENPSWEKSVKPHAKRKYFFKAFNKGKSIEYIVKKCLKIPLKERILWRVRNYKRRFIK